jgi:hypothetical protein
LLARAHGLEFKAFLECLYCEVDHRGVVQAWVDEPEDRRAHCFLNYTRVIAPCVSAVYVDDIVDAAKH